MDDTRTQTDTAEVSPAVQAAIDALPAQIVVLDAEGVVLAANAAWHRGDAVVDLFGARTVGVGGNYLEACRGSEGPGHRALSTTARALEELLRDRRGSMVQTCPGQGPGASRAYFVRATRVLGADRAAAVVAHQEIGDYWARDEMPPAELVEQAMTGIERALRTGETQFFDQRVTFRGDVRVYDTRIVVSGPDEVLGIVRDITERRRIEARLELSSRMVSVGTLAAGAVKVLELVREEAQVGQDVGERVVALVRRERPVGRIHELREWIADAREGAEQVHRSVRALRLMMNYLLVRAGYPPAIIHAHDRHHYFSALDGSRTDLVPVIVGAISAAIDAAEAFSRPEQAQQPAAAQMAL